MFYGGAPYIQYRTNAIYDHLSHGNERHSAAEFHCLAPETDSLLSAMYRVTLKGKSSTEYIHVEAEAEMNAQSSRRFVLGRSRRH